MPGKLYVQTFGCQMNEYDSARMADVLRESHGLETVSDPSGRRPRKKCFLCWGVSVH